MNILSGIFFAAIAIISSLATQKARKDNNRNTISRPIAKKNVNPYFEPSKDLSPVKQVRDALKEVIGEMVTQYQQAEKTVIMDDTPIESIKKQKVELTVPPKIDQVKENSGKLTSRLVSNKSTSLVSVVERNKEVDIYDVKPVKGSIQPKMNRNTLLQGVIMAEILQPPRAKRPYKPIYQQKN